MLNWKEIDVPAFEKILSTGQAQPLSPDDWPRWAHTAPGFSGACLYPVLSQLATSTGSLSTEQVHAYIDIERSATRPPSLRYYRYLYVKMTDGRLFQSPPFKDIEYEHHREERPP